MNLVKKAENINKVCPIYRCAAIFESKWALVILRDLFMNGPMRFKDFKTNTPNLTDRALNQTLNRLQELKLVAHLAKDDTSPPILRYQLSDYGLSLNPIIIAMIGWGSGMGKTWWKEIRQMEKNKI
jgi:DNA-binding HxlR family transcriptional regulator